MVEKAVVGIRVLTLLVIALFLFTLVNCNFWAILEANGHQPSPNTLQLTKGWECTCDVWLNHYLFFL